MNKFKVRKTGADLHSLPFYNSYQDGLYNALFPEYAPLSVGGTMSDLDYKNAKGNCTWYAFGRQQEATGYRIPLDRRRGNAKDWLVDSSTPKVGSVVVFVDNGFGHVAFVEKIENGKVYVSESAYSERGNDFLFKYGRTVSEICQVWDMTVKGYMLPAGEFTSYDGVQGELKAENGIFTATSIDGSNIRKSPSLSAERVNGLPKGEEIAYTGYVDNDGIRWVQTDKGYIARKKLDDSEFFGDARFADEQPRLNAFGQNVFRYSVIEFTQIFKTKNGTETLPLENGKGSVAWVDESARNPYEVWKNNKFWGYVRPENTK
jgi:hypothetical protein